MQLFQNNRQPSVVICIYLLRNKQPRTQEQTRLQLRVRYEPQQEMKTRERALECTQSQNHQR